MEPFQQQHEEDGCVKVDATDAARARALALGIGVEVVTGTGSNGRVTRDDVEAHAAKLAHRGGRVDTDAETPSAPEPGEHVVPSGDVPKDGPAVNVTIVGDRDCVTFHCSTNPDFNLQSRKLRRTIYFTEGCYETSDPTEITALRACQFVEEVSG